MQGTIVENAPPVRITKRYQKMLMNHVRGYNLTALLALICSGGLVLAVLGGLLVGQDLWLTRLATLAVALLIAAVVTFGLFWPVQRQMKVAKHYFDHLSHISPSQTQLDTIDTNLPLLPSDHPMRVAAERLKTLLVTTCEQVQDLEHARNAADIRCHRACDERDQIKSILQALDEPILAIDRFDELLLANPSAQSLLNLDAESLEHRMLGQIVKCERLINLLTTTCHRKNTEDYSDEIEIEDPSGQGNWYRVTARKLVSDSSTNESDSLGAVAVLRDIGETKVLQRRNAEFVSSLSHEMKTPLAGIKAYVELLADGEAEDQKTRDEFLGVIDSQAQRLQRLVENLLNLARMEAGVVKVDKNPGRSTKSSKKHSTWFARPPKPSKSSWFPT